jgi:receptor protein-tyrosine kinase
MSIIEKAAGKLGGSAERRSETDIAAAGRESLIESALEKRHASEHVVAQPAQPVEPLWAASDAQAAGPVSQVQSINLARLHRMGVVSPDAEKSQIAEEFRIIKRPLIANAFGQGTARVRNGNMIMVTSSLPGEGKTFCAIIILETF